MSLFGDLDIQSANDNPFFKPDGTYVCHVYGVEVKATKADPNKKGLNITYKIAEGEEKAGQNITEWKDVPREDDLMSDAINPKSGNRVADEAARSLSFLKQRLKDFGVPEDRLNSVEPKDLHGLRVAVTIQNQNGNERVKTVKLVDAD